MKIPKAIADERDRLAESGSQNGPYQPYNSQSFKTGFDCGFSLGMREANELVEALEHCYSNSPTPTGTAHDAMIDKALQKYRERVEG